MCYNGLELQWGKEKGVQSTWMQTEIKLFGGYSFAFFAAKCSFCFSIWLIQLFFTITFQFHVEFFNSTFFQLNFPTTRQLFWLKYLTSEIDRFQVVYKTRPSKSDSKLDCDFKFRNRLILIYRQLQIAIWSWMHQIQSYIKLVDQTKIRRKFQTKK